MTGDALTLQVISTPEAFDRLQPAWDALLQESAISPFQSFEYQRTWWKHFGETNPRATLHIVTVTDNDRLVGVAPFFVEEIRVVAGISYRRLAFIGREVTDYLDLLVAHGHEEPCVRRIAQHLADLSSQVDVVLLEDITERSRTCELLYDQLTMTGLPGNRFVAADCPRTQLRDSWEATLESFNIDHRREIRRRKRNLNKNFTVEFETTSSETNILEDMEEFIRMHQHRWTKSGHRGVFADPRVASLHREIAPLFFKRGWLFLGFLRVDGRRIATNYGYFFHDELSIFLGGATEAPDVWKYSPGRVLTGYCMEEAIQRGMRVYDFMRGTEQYKYEFDGVDVKNWTFVFFNASRQKTARMKLNLDTLLHTLKRRAQRERILFQFVVHENGAFSLPTFKHLVSRPLTVVADGRSKLLGGKNSAQRHPPRHTAT
ncbi:MAG: GNAT family N-acetyltransferase, partial [Bacteroidota bacterium]